MKIGKMSDGQAIKRGRKSLDDKRNASDMGEAGFDERGVCDPAGTDDCR
jgi:hypothetical protein